jgi:demethylmenaquinone methyltransferase/2-methoxy-6-polyprenyl-1,4-benzoquinol methylase
LDVCCGTGDIAFGLASRGAAVVGVDFSAAMLEIAKKRAASVAEACGQQNNASAQESSPRFIQADAQQLPFADSSFEVVTIGYGLRNLASWERGLEEMWRVAQPGGRLLVLDFGKPENAFVREIYFGYLKWIVPLFGKLFCSDSATYSYIFESLRHYPAQQGVAEKMRALGCEDVRIFNFLAGAMSINAGRKSTRSSTA